MRKVYLILASSMALAFAACDRNANNNQAPAPSNYGGGPSTEQPATSSQGTYDQGASPAPVGSAGHELPGTGTGLAPSTDIRNTDGFGGTGGMSNESNGGSGAGATGSKGEGTTLHNGLNDQGTKARPPQEQKKVDLMPGDNTPGTNETDK